MKKFFTKLAVGALLLSSIALPRAWGAINNPGSPAQAGTGLTQAGSTLSVNYGTTAATAKQGNAVDSVAQGGTGFGSLTANAILLGNGTSAVQLVSPGSSGTVLTSNGTGSAPTYQVPPTALVSSVFGQTGAIPNLSGDVTTAGSSAVTLANTSTARTDIGLGTANNVTFGSLQATPIGVGSASTGAFTTLNAVSTVSGAGFSTYLASPPAIGSTAANTGAFTTLSASSTVSGTGFTTYLASPPAIGGTVAAAGNFTTLGTSGVYTAASAVNFAGPVSISSASTVAIGAAASNNVTITGTTAITAFDTVPAGVQRSVNFSGALTLTYNSTSLVLPGKANMAIQAGDRAEFVSLGSGNWAMINYLPVNAGLFNHGEAVLVTLTATQSMSNNTATKILPNTAIFDTNSNFDNVTAFTFKPLVPGYYQVNAGVSCGGTGVQNCIVFIYKNGGLWRTGAYVSTTATFNGTQSTATALIYFNGSTDYAELYAEGAAASGLNVVNGASNTYFEAVFVRSN